MIVDSLIKHAAIGHHRPHPEVRHALPVRVVALCDPLRGQFGILHGLFLVGHVKIQNGEIYIQSGYLLDILPARILAELARSDNLQSLAVAVQSLVDTA